MSWPGERGGLGFHLSMERPLLLASTMLGLLAISSIHAAERPNIVLIVADDLGWNHLSCYGSDLHETPNLDRLAGEGVRFTQAYAASPVCTPTRAALLTGKFPARLKMTVWREGASQRRNRAVLEPVVLDSLPVEHLTLAEVFRDAGYATAHVGKWHLGRAPSYPEAHGFQFNIGGTLWGAPETFFYPFNEQRTDYFDDWRYVPGLEPGEPGDYLTDRLTDRALEMIDAFEDRPFFLNLWFYSVHTPVEGKPEVVAKYEERIRQNEPEVHVNPHLAAMVESVDENVGRVMKRLEERGLAKKTIVVFTSDNGGFIGRCRLNPEQPVTNLAPLRSGKGSCYEGGLRVPLIVRGPGIAPSATCPEAVFSCDLFPTLAGRARLSERIEEPIDGIDLSRLLSDPEASLDRDALYFHFPHYYSTTSPVSAIREGDWKLLQYHEDGRVELYDLAKDESETQDLAAARPEVVERLRGKLGEWLLETEAQLPEPNTAD